MAQLTVKEGVTLRKLFQGVMKLFTGGGAGGDAVDEPMDGIGGAQSSANLGGGAGGIGGEAGVSYPTHAPRYHTSSAPRGILSSTLGIINTPRGYHRRPRRC
jgi:hypothetical protein